MRIHLIAIGGKVMHNLALELQAHGHVVTGSDDEIYDPARSRLEQAGLLPIEIGWDERRIQRDIDIIILGMHAYPDNPELIKAREFGIEIVSFPEYIGKYTSNKLKIVVCGSHGKSTITAMIMHVLKYHHIDSDYLLGGLLRGFERMVRITGAPIMVLEGDEYLSSRIDPTPKMMHYLGNVVIITGIEWDHMNVFPTFENYISQFEKLISDCKKRNATIVWYKNDHHLSELVAQAEYQNCIPYEHIELASRDSVVFEGVKYKMNIFGQHNMSNMNAAKIVCNIAGVSDEAFFLGMSTFIGVGGRMELIHDHPKIYKDYAHAPSKVRATLEALRTHHGAIRILAVYELHTYSSLNKDFLPNYKHTLQHADQAIVYYDAHALEMKRMPELNAEHIALCFDHRDLKVITSSNELFDNLKDRIKDVDVLIMMSSGNFGNLDIDKLVN